MRRIVAIILTCFLLATIAYADNAVSSSSATATVSQSGSCQVVLSVTIRLDEPVKNLTFPIGANVSAVSLNGVGASTTKVGGITHIKLNQLSGQVGSFPMTISFTINSVLSEDEDGRQIVTVPLLYGFAYPVEQLSFSVTLPAEFDTVPAFYSGYHEQDIERSLTSRVSGNTVTGSITAPLKDSETLFMVLEATEDMFPQVQSAGGTLTADAIGMGVCAALAILYWLVTMRCLPSFPIRRSTPPEGLSAGNVGSYLVHKSADLTMMVVTWAQLGYLLIHVDENGRVMLHKKMDMGNERNSFEQRCFRNLFQKGRLLDATGYRYARLCENTARMSRRFASGRRKDSGNPELFRGLACGVGLFAGVAIGDCITTSPTWRVIWMVLMGFLGTLTSWHIQEGMSWIHLRSRMERIIALACSMAFLAVGSVFGCLVYAAIAVVWNLFAGLAAAYGGRRSENGKRIYADVLGLRRYMKKVSKAELARILRSNPDYYFELAPYAMALGVDKQFAARFGNMRQPGCTWLVTGMGPAKTANEWYPLLRDAVNAMDNLQKRPFWERFR